MKNKRRTSAYIMTLILIFSLIGCAASQKPVSPVSPASHVTIISDTTSTFETYSNDRFGFSLSYPDIYTIKTESDNGDGISMESSDKLHTLKIWGGYNVNNSSGVDLMNLAKNRVSHISYEYADDHVYKLEYGGGDDTPIIFNEVSCVNGEQQLGFIISYPEKEKEKGGYTDIVTKMTNELTENSIKNSKEELVNKKGTNKISNLNEVLNLEGIFSTTLDENMSTGYGWYYIIENNEIIKLDSESNIENNLNELGLAGAGSKHTWNFKGVKQGTTKITFKYYQSWLGERSAAETVEYTIKVI